MYKFTLAEPIDTISELEFPRLTWGALKKLSLASSGVKSFVEAFVAIATPALTPEQIERLTPSDFESFDGLFAHMKDRDDEYNGRRLDLTTPIKIAGMEVTAFTFRATSLGDMWEYYEATDQNERADIFMHKFARPVGDDAKLKDTPLAKSHFAMIDAKDMIFIRDRIAGKSQGGSASWTIA